MTFLTLQRQEPYYLSKNPVKGFFASLELCKQLFRQKLALKSSEAHFTVTPNKNIVIVKDS